MSISYLVIEKINELNRRYSKREIKSNLLHVLKVKENNPDLISFQKEIFHNGQYNKNLEYLSKINNSHSSFFNNVIVSNTDKIHNLFKCTEKIISSLTLEKNKLKNFSVNSQQETFYNNQGIASLLYSENHLGQAVDYISGHFLFNQRLINSILNENNITLNFEYIEKFLNISNQNHTLIAKEKTQNLLKKSIIIKNILNPQFDSENVNAYNFNEYFKNYMSFPYSLDENNKIKNSKKHPLSFSMSSQSIVNLIEQDNYMSANSLYYGLYPVASIEKERLKINDVTNFSIVGLKEIIPLKFIENEENFKINQNEEFNQFKEKSVNHLLNSQNYFLSANEKNLNAENINFYQNYFENTKFHNLLNCDNVNDFSSFSKVFLMNKKQINERYTLNSQLETTNKLNIFSHAVNTSYIDPSRESNRILINTTDFAGTSQAEKFKLHSLNLIELISSFVNTDSMHVLEVYKDNSRKSRIQVDQNALIPSFGIQNTIINGPGGRQASTMSGNIDRGNNNENSGSNITYYTEVSYRKKNLLTNGKKGIHNVSYLEEEKDFSNSILRTKKDVDFVVKQIKNLKNNSFSNLFVSRIDSVYKEEISNLKNNIKISQNDEQIKRNLDTIEKMYQYPSDHIDTKFNFLGNATNINVSEENFTTLEKEGKINIPDIFSDLDENSSGVSEDIFINENLIKERFNKKIDPNELSHFSSSTSLFEFITNFCRNFIQQNLKDTDNLNNFSKRANITETATLLGLYNNSTKGMSYEEKKELRNIINITTSRRLLTPLSLVNDRERIFEKIKDNIEYLTNINPFYLFGENLNDNENYDFYNPYENSDSVFDQNGLFYHFLFSNYHQEKSFRYKKLDDLNYEIEEAKNCSNLNENNKSPFYFSFNGKDNLNENEKQKFSIKNVFNSGIYDYAANRVKNINIFRPRFSMIKYKENISFLVTHESNDHEKFVDLKNYITSYFRTLKERKNQILGSVPSNNKVYTDLLFPESLYDFINEFDTIIQEKNILNIASPDKSFFNYRSHDNFFDKLVSDLFAAGNIKILLQNGSLNEMNLSNILNSIFSISNEIFLKMYFELQGYTTICNRLFDSSLFSKGSSTSLTKQYMNVPEENINKLIDNLENVRNFYNLFRGFTNEGYEKAYARLKQEYSINDNADNNDVNFSISERTNVLFPASTFKNRPSFIKLFYSLKNIFKIRDNDLEKIATYIFSNSEFHSKFHFIFDIFNIHSIKSQNYFENINSLLDTSKFETIDPVKDQYISNSNLRILNFLNDANCIFFDYLFDDILRSDNEISHPIYNSFGGNIFKDNGEINLRLEFINTQSSFVTGEYNSLYRKIFEIFSIVLSGNNLENIKNSQIKNYISLKDIFEQIISKSYEKSFNYNIEEKVNAEQRSSYVKSGCEIINDTYNDFLSYSDLNPRNLLWINNQNNTNGFINFQNYKNISRFNRLENINSVDMQHNWYNQILRGLLINDISYVMNMEIIKYFNSYQGIGKDIQDTYNFINNYRNKDNSESFFNISTNSAKNTLKNQTGFTQFKLKNNNFKLKDAYIHQFFKAKIVKNVKDKYLLENQNIEAVVPILKDEFFKNYLKDFYIESNIQNDILTEKSTSVTSNLYSNSAHDLENSTILTVGIDKEVEIKKNDIVLLTIEMIDHDYPDLIWEKKTFEFDSSINNPVDDVFTFKSQNNRQDLINSELSKIKNSLNFPLTDYFPSSEAGKKLLNEIISSQDISTPNKTNNIANPFLLLFNMVESNMTTNIDDLIQRRFEELKDSYIPRLQLLGLTSISDNQLILKDMIKRSIFNQLNSFRLEKVLKFLTGFEGKNNFSIQVQEEKFLQGCYILSEIYDLFVSQIFNSTNVENLGFTNEELTNAFSIDGLGTFENDVSYKGYNFKIASMTTNHHLNILLNFMHAFTNAIIPDFSKFANSNFSRIYNVAVKPEDFIVTTIKYQNTEIPAINAYPDLNFLNIETVEPIKDEIGTFYNKVNIDVYREQNIRIKNYQINKGNSKYIPKNVSYRIKLDLLEN